MIRATKASLQQLPPLAPPANGIKPAALAPSHNGGNGGSGFDGCASAAVKATRGEAAIKERERALLPVYQQVREDTLRMRCNSSNRVEGA